MTILHIDSSARREGSVSRVLSARVAAALGGDIIRRDLAEPLPHVTEGWVAANFTPADARNSDHSAALTLSDALVAELQGADTLVIGLPIYNFGIPAALKAWIDLVARAGVTFRYTENGPQGLLTGKRAVLVVASGGTQVGSEIDFATGYLRHVLGFLGITDVRIVAADRLGAGADEVIRAAEEQITQLAA